jgi:hypothetical protein
MYCKVHIGKHFPIQNGLKGGALLPGGTGLIELSECGSQQMAILPHYGGGTDDGTPGTWNPL